MRVTGILSAMETKERGSSRAMAKIMLLLIKREKIHMQTLFKTWP
jgi:hypothetical protein